MHVESAHFFQVAVVAAVGGDELGDDGERAVRVHLEARAGPVESAVVQTVRGKVAAVLVANALVTR